MTLDEIDQDLKNRFGWLYTGRIWHGDPDPQRGVLTGNVVAFTPKPREASPFTRASVSPIGPRIKEKDELRFLVTALTELNQRQEALPGLLLIRDLLVTAVKTNAPAKNATWRKLCALSLVVGEQLSKYELAPVEYTSKDVSY